MRPKARPSVVAVHEAGHAVAAARLGLGSRGARVHRTRDGSGVTYGGGRPLTVFQGSDGELLAYTVRALAGGYAEARYTRKSIAVVLLTTARQDWDHYNRVLNWLTVRCACRVATDLRLKIINDDLWEELRDLCDSDVGHLTHEFVRSSWDQIMLVATRLDRHGYLSAPMVRQIVNEA